VLREEKRAVDLPPVSRRFSSFFFLFFFTMAIKSSDTLEEEEEEEKKKQGRMLEKTIGRTERKSVTVDCTPLIPKCAVVVLCLQRDRPSRE
jgi:hypothetical protein